MYLISVTATNVDSYGSKIRSTVIVNMDKFVDAVEGSDHMINMWFEGPFSVTVSRNDFMDFLEKVDLEVWDMPGIVSSKNDRTKK